MNWVNWLIFLIPIAVWILANLARNREEPRRPARPSQPNEGAGEPVAAPRPRRSSAEIDEFLQEVRRRREANEQRKAARRAPVKPEPRREVETPRPRPSLSMPEPLAPPPPPTPVAVPVAPGALPPAPTGQGLPRVVGRISTVREEIVTARVVSDPVPLAERAPPARPATPAAVIAVRRLGPPAKPRDILQMLKNPQSLARAIVLREILEPPLSRRRGRRGWAATP